MTLQKEIDTVKAKMKRYDIKQKEVAKAIGVSESWVGYCLREGTINKYMWQKIVTTVDRMAEGRETKLQKMRAKYKDDEVFKDYIIHHQYLPIKTIALNCGRNPSDVMPLYNEYIEERYGRLNYGDCV